MWRTGLSVCSSRWATVHRGKVLYTVRCYKPRFKYYTVVLGSRQVNMLTRLLTEQPVLSGMGHEERSTVETLLRKGLVKLVEGRVQLTELGLDVAKLLKRYLEEKGVR